MGKLVEDFWTYRYKNKSYYGIVEVVSGELRFRKADTKYETRIEKAIDYLNGKRRLSHMSLQSYNVYLNKTGQSSRDKNEEAYYPFFMEFEPHIKPGNPGFEYEYKRAISEAYRTANYLIYEMNVQEEDILLQVTNSRSVYLMLNPVTYGLRPSNVLHEVYRNMYMKLDEALGFKYVDTNLFRFNGLIKTPGSYYSGGYVVPISIQELRVMLDDPIKARNSLTKNQRSLADQVPGIFSKPMRELYEEAIDIVKGSKKRKAMKAKYGERKVSYLQNGIACVSHFENSMVEPGQRNFALVAIAIAYRNAGYSEEQTLEIVLDAAERWDHDEDKKIVQSKVKTVFEKKYNFSCEYLNQHVNLCGACESCRFNKCGNKQERTKFVLSRSIVQALQSHKASLRHYKAYLVISRNNLNNQFFDPDEHGVDRRTIRELSKIIKAERIIRDGLVRLTFDQGEKKYLIPNEFIDNEEYVALGEKLKHYLVLYTHFIYTAKDKYGLMHVKPATIAKILGFKAISSVYRLIKELVSAGMAVFKKGYLFSLYFSSYKVISLDEYKHMEKNTESLKRANKEVVNGNYYEKLGVSTGNLNHLRGSP